MSQFNNNYDLLDAFEIDEELEDMLGEFDENGLNGWDDCDDLKVLDTQDMYAVGELTEVEKQQVKDLWEEAAF